MQPPEETFPSNLSWPQFKSAYSIVRKHSAIAEVSAAWSRYKLLVPKPKISPVKSLTKTSPGRSPVKSPSKKSPSYANVVVRIPREPTVGAIGKGPLELLPGDIRRYIPGLVPSVAPTMQRLSKLMKASTLLGGYAQLCDLEISLREVSLLLDRKRRYLDLNPDVGMTEVWFGLFPTLTFMQQHPDRTTYQFKIYVELRQNSVQIHVTVPNGYVVNIPPNLYTLGWQFVKYIILKEYQELYQKVNRYFEEREPSKDYLLVFDRLSLYDIFQHRKQCMQLSVEYANIKSLDILMEYWRREMEIFAENNIDLADNMFDVMYQYVNGIVVNNLVVPGFDALNETSVRNTIMADIPPPIDARLSAPFKSKPCVVGITRDMIFNYLHYLIARERINVINWASVENGRWVGSHTSLVTTYTGVEPTNAHVNGIQEYLLPKQSRYLKGEALVKAGKRLEIAKKPIVNLEQLADVIVASEHFVLSVEHLEAVLHLNEGCVIRDHNYARKEAKRLVTSALNSLLRPYNTTIEEILRTPDFFSRFYAKKLTLEAYNLLSQLLLFVRRVTEHTTSDLVLNMPYKTYETVSGEVLNVLRKYYTK